MPPLYAYLALIASAFTSATLLPGTSEAAYAAFVYQYPQHALGACLCAGLANGLGSMVSYYMGRMFPAKKRPSEKVLARIQRWGIWPLLFAWLPIIGDTLPLAAGWLRLNALHCAIILITGKLLRYTMIYWGMNAVAG